MIPAGFTKKKQGAPPTVILMARAPIPGHCNTRLAPRLGERGAARIQSILIADRARAVRAAKLPLVVEATPDIRHPCFLRLRHQVRSLRRQFRGSLGLRMWRAVRRQPGPVLVIGTDCPALTSARLVAAARALEEHPAIMIPADDGGYVLIGLRQACPRLFSMIPWGGNRVAQRSARQARRAGLDLRMLPALPDLDRPRDYHQHRRQAQLPAFGYRPAESTT